MKILLRNRDVLDDIDAGTAQVARPLQKLFHWLNKNTKRGSRRNIAAHYDLGNDFYALWLDTRMMYSSAFFSSTTASLEEAAVEKLDRTRIAAEGLADRITLLKDDYRDLEGTFDKLVSIEMIEAVGHEYLDTFFEKCASLLQPDGEMLLQAITIADQRYEKARKTVDFIKRYVFPGGFLPSLTAITSSMTRVTELRAIAVEDIGLHYALTLKHWRDRFFGRLAEVRKQGFSDEFIRLWEFYLCYCEGAFTERAIGTVQLHAIGAESRPAIEVTI